MGQQINVSLLDFATSNDERTHAGEPKQTECNQLGYLIDRPARKNITVCGGGTDREVLVHLSQRNVLELVLISSGKDGGELDVNYLVRMAGLFCRKYDL